MNDERNSQIPESEFSETPAPEIKEKENEHISSTEIKEEQEASSRPEVNEEPQPVTKEPTSPIPPPVTAGISFGNGTEPPKKKKNKGIGWILGLAALYLLSMGGLFALILSGALRFRLPETSETNPPETVTATEEDTEHSPIVENPSTDGNHPIVGDGYTGQAIPLPDLYEKAVDSVVFVEASYRQGFSTGSGFVIDSENGYILTNYHVVEGSTEIAITFKNSESYVAKLVGGDEINDIAVLKVDAKNLKHVTIGNSSLIRPGEDVLIIGNPLGDLTFTLTRGIVSAVNRTINTGEYNIATFQTDAAINSGNSGGPAFDATGAVIGIASAKYADTGVEGIGFCIPINDAMTIARDLVNYGYVKGRPNFGIAVSDSTGYEYVIDPDTGRRVLVETARGARVEEVGKNSCAAKAGLKVGDIITKIGSKKITTANQLINIKNTYKAGDQVSLEIYRSGETLVLNVTLDEYTP